MKILSDVLNQPPDDRYITCVCLACQEHPFSYKQFAESLMSPQFYAFCTVTLPLYMSTLSATELSEGKAVRIILVLKFTFVSVPGLLSHMRMDL